MTRRILIACPTNAGAPDHTTALSISRMQMEAAERGWITDTIYRVRDSMITRARSVLFSQFYASECTDMLFIDDDVGCAPRSFLRVMDHPVDLVGGSYRSRRGDIEEFVLKTLPGDALQFDHNQKTGLMEVEGVPTGFMRITRAVADAMIKADPDGWYNDSTAPEGLKVYNVFDFFFDRGKHEYWSEDFNFCRRWRELGGKVWVDPFLTLTHTGKDAFRGQLLDYLKRKNPAIGAAMNAAAATPAQSGTLVEAVKALLAPEAEAA